MFRSHLGQKKDVNYLTNLPGASERLQIFNADFDKPESFNESIQGCVGVFHVAHNVEFEAKEDEETNLQASINVNVSILRACLDSKTVKRVVYTSSSSAVLFSGKDSSVVDETLWTDVDFVRSLKSSAGPYYISKTLTERAALEFAEKHGLDLVTVIPTLFTVPSLILVVPAQCVLQWQQYLVCIFLLQNLFVVLDIDDHSGEHKVRSTSIGMIKMNKYGFLFSI